MSQLFSQTLREAPAEAEIASHQLLLRAGYIRQLAAGIFSYLPLARRTMNKIEAIIRQEMEAIGGQEITMPVVHPADIWKETRRWYKIDAEMARFQDRSGRDMVLAMTHEEVVADLVRRQVHSYRQLPQMLFHIQTKFRDDPRPRAGLIRVREFTMKDSYSLDTDWDGLDRQYRAHHQAYFNVFKRCGLPVIAVKADVGMMGGSLAHEFMYLTDIGEDTLLICNSCGFSANRQVATFRKALPDEETPRATKKVATPACKSIEDLANFLDIPKSRTAKAVFLVANIPDGETKLEHLIFAVIRGDMEVNETKLANAVKAQALRPATEAEIRLLGAVPGYASPVGLKGALVIVDDAIPHSPNLVAGANEEGYHLLNTNYGRDYQAEIIADIAAAQDGDLCPRCSQPLRGVRGVEVGNIFKLGTHFSESMGCTYLDADGQTHPVVMGSYGIGIGRLMACIAEQHHDEYGLVWPVSVAPYLVHLVLLAGKGSAENPNIATRLYTDLQSAGIDTLYDDRSESPGVKFNDADLIGLPLRLTVSERALKAGGVELKRRDLAEREVVPLDQVIPRLRTEFAELQSQIDQSVVLTELSET
ncbi:MAG: proline--tRNA ligase [Chloroflexi bacterium RBG_16_57_11]|nr:MAG: proline--tRNA ligase [Chloroflexi bacterium RBG_16_57_11]